MLSCLKWIQTDQPDVKTLGKNCTFLKQWVECLWESGPCHTFCKLCFCHICRGIYFFNTSHRLPPVIFRWHSQSINLPRCQTPGILIVWSSSPNWHSANCEHLGFAEGMQCQGWLEGTPCPGTCAEKILVSTKQFWDKLHTCCVWPQGGCVLPYSVWFWIRWRVTAKGGFLAALVGQQSRIWWQWWCSCTFAFTVATNFASDSPNCQTSERVGCVWIHQLGSKRTTNMKPSTERAVEQLHLETQFRTTTIFHTTFIDLFCAR